jgi:hypothetical protein
VRRILNATVGMMGQAGAWPLRRDSNPACRHKTPLYRRPL